MAGYVIIKTAPEMDYMKDFVSLPDNYGTYDYFNRKDIKAIRETVFSALSELDEKTNFSEEIKKLKKVLIKPNLVSVYHNMGLKETDYPESTDPRVFEAVVNYIRKFTNDITIIESSGKPMPTSASFKAAGYDRIAEYYNTKLVAMETRPAVRYILPKAEIMKEVYVPDILDDVIKGKAFYISVPKMKTNLYTGVTLGFKNAMGTIPYFMRERNHNYNIDKKLADLLYLFKPGLTVIDGIIGGEGNTPAPVDPVKVGKIVVSDNSVEADRVTTHMMGFDPEKNKLMIEATKRNFGDPTVEIIGDTSVTKFRPAISSFMDEKTGRDFPNLLAVAGHNRNNAPKIEDINSVTPETALALEQACAGGCLAASKTGLEYFLYKDGIDCSFKLCVIEGEGVVVNGERYWFDKHGKPYTLNDLKSLDMPKYGMGDCAISTAGDICQFKADGCCDPANNMTTICMAAGHLCPIFSLKNKSLLDTGTGMMGVVLKRMYYTAKGEQVDCKRHAEDKVYEIPNLSEKDLEKDFIEWPLPKLTFKERLSGIADQADIMFCSFRM